MTSRAVSDSRLRRLFDANVVGILIGNNAGGIVEANDAFLQTIGYSRAELEAGFIDWRRLTPTEWLAFDERAIAEMAERGSFAQYEKEFFRKDGTRVPISVGGARIEGTDDQQICYVVDLSEIRRTEAALRRSEKRFERLADANVIGIVTALIGCGRIVESNDEFLRMIAMSRDEFKSSNVSLVDLASPESADARRQGLRELREVGRFTPFEAELTRKDGSRIPVLIGGALLDEASGEVVCYVLDLSEQREALMRTRESEARYRVLTEALPEIVMLATADRGLVYVNKRYEEYTGIGSAELAQRWRDVIHPDDLEAIDRARAGGMSYEVEYRLRRASDGAYRWHFARCLEIPDSSPAGRWLAAATDIDDRKRAEESLRFIEKAGTLLSQSLDLERTFETLLDLVVPEFGDWATINLRDEDGRTKTISARHADPAKASFAKELCGVSYINEAENWGSPAVYRNGRPQLMSDLCRDDLLTVIKDRYVPVVEALGYGSFIVLPIFSAGEVIGTIAITSAGGRRRYTEADLPPLEELARRAGFAIANASRFEREHRVADLLQEAALPSRLPAVAGLRFDSHYQAGRREASIGGDWFDAFVIPNGKVIVTVGDVAGSGLEAAVLMGNVRQVLRGAAHADADPRRMLEIADGTLRSEHEEAFVTAFVGIIDPKLRTMSYASAGHVPALVRTRDGAVVELDAPGLPLGMHALGPCVGRTADLPAGSCLLLYTDGLVEWSRDIVAGEALLRRTFGEASVAGAEHPAKFIVERILEERVARDDVAVLTVSFDG